MPTLPSRSAGETTKLSINIKTQLSKFKLSYSTSLFPSNLKNAFSKTPTTTASAAAAAAKTIQIEEDTPSQNSNCNKSKKAIAAAKLINTKPWAAPLESRLSTALTPLSQTAFFQTLRRIKTPSNALRFFNWAQSSGFTHNHHSYFIMLQILGRARHLNPARNFLFSIPKKSNNTVPLTDKFFNSLIRSYGDAGLYQESLKIFQVMKSMAVSPSTVTFNSLFSILLKRGRMGMVFELYNEMLKTYGAKPDSYTFNVLIRGLCMNSSVDEAFRMFKEMEKFDCKPDLITYNTIVDGLCRTGKVSIARNVVTGLFKTCEDLRPNVVTYTTLIRGYCGKREIEEAFDVFREMIGGGITPNEITCNTLIQGLCESRKFDMIKEVLRECGGTIVPDTCTFNTMMNAHCNSGNLEEALIFFEKMKEMNVKRDSATYSVIIRALCEKGSFEKAEELLDELFGEEILLRGDNCTPIIAAYNPIFNYLCTNGKTKKAERVFRQLMKRGTHDPIAFETLIFGQCKEGNFQDAHNLLILMLRRDFLPSVKIYESLIDGLLKKKEANLAHDTLEKMLRSKYIPRASKFHGVLMELVEKEYAKESADLMGLMLEKEIRPNVNLSTDVVRVLFKNCMNDKAFEILTSLYGNSYVVNMEELVSFLCGGGKLVEVGELLVFGLKNDQIVDSGLFDRVVTSLCKGGMALEGFRVYYELLEKDARHPLGCVEDLRNALVDQGKLTEADFVAKRMTSNFVAV
ncbi:hypothetical protein ABFS82_06G054400 [Erythranthe guttata]